MRRYRVLLMLPLFLFIGLIMSSFVGVDNASAGSHVSGIVEGATVSNTSNSASTFEVSLQLAEGYEQQGSFSCWLPKAGAEWSGTPSEIHVEDSGNDTYTVYLLPPNEYYGAKNYGSSDDTCTQFKPWTNPQTGNVVSDACAGYQSLVGTVKKKSSTTEEDDDCDTCTTDDSDDNTPTTTTIEVYEPQYYYNYVDLKVEYVRQATGEYVSCMTSPSLIGSYSYKVSYYDIYKETYTDGVLTSREYVTSTSEQISEVETAYYVPPQSLCGGEYELVGVNDGPFYYMDNNITITAYYEKVHHLYMDHARIVGRSSICGWPTQIGRYTDSTSTTVWADNPISCYSGVYDFYEFWDQNNVSVSGSGASPSSTLYDSSTTAIYRRRNTLTLKHINYYDRNGPLITTDQSTTVHDYENATISPVANNFNYGGYEYELYGYADGRNSTVVPSKNTTYTAYSLTSDITRWALYKKVLYLTVIPVDRNGNRLASNLVQRVLEGDSASIKTYTTIGNYTFTGFGADYRNPGFPSSYIYSVPTMRDHVNIYAVYETSDSLTSACPPTNGAMVQSYVRNLRFDGAWNRETTYAKPGDQISYCTGYNNKYPYWNFMYPDYDYLVNYGSYYNPNRAYPIGYRGAVTLNNQLYSSYSVTSNRTNPLQYYENKQLSFVQNRANQQENFKSTKRATIKNYPANASEASIAFNKNDVGLASGVYEQGHINSISSNTSTAYVHDVVSNVSSGKVISSLPRSKLDFNTAKAVFPYNFQNSTSINKGSNNYVDSGGTTTLSINLTVNPKANAATHTEIGGNYATVDEGDIYYRVEVTTSDNSVARTVTDPIRYRTRGTSTNKINAENKVGGDSVTIASRTLYVPDVNPGVDVCFRTSMWPKNSDKDGTGTSTDVNGGYTSTADESSWSDWSQPVCYRAKSVPTLQAWGGNIIANGQIATSFKQKFHIYPNTYLPLGPYKESHIFGSWGELGIIANRDTEFLASGTALGYPNGLLAPATTGVSNDTRAQFVPLTFANYNPLLPTIPIFGGLNKTYSSEEQTFDKSTLVNKYIYNTGVNYNNSTLTLNGDITASYMGTDYYHADNNVYYYHANPNLQIGSSKIAKNATQVIHVNGDIRITGDITYLDTYTRLENIPKLIIYADGGTIKIDRNVSQVDAILIADTVVTCSEESGCKIPVENEVVTNPYNSERQLRINGTIIAKQVIPNRTYGAGHGVGQYNDGSVNSITPAEVINYDPSLYRWEQYSANQNESTIKPDASLVTTYLKEVAPRY